MTLSAYLHTHLKQFFCLFRGQAGSSSIQYKGVGLSYAYWTYLLYSIFLFQYFFTVVVRCMFVRTRLDPGIRLHR